MALGNGTMALGRGLLLMWNYEKRLEYPINIKETNPKIAKFIMSQAARTVKFPLACVIFPKGILCLTVR